MTTMYRTCVGHRFLTNCLRQLGQVMTELPNKRDVRRSGNPHAGQVARFRIIGRSRSCRSAPTLWLVLDAGFVLRILGNCLCWPGGRNRTLCKAPTFAFDEEIADLSPSKQA